MVEQNFDSMVPLFDDGEASFSADDNDDTTLPALPTLVLQYLWDMITDILYVSIEPLSSPELLTAAIIFVDFAPLSLSTLFYYRVYQIGNPVFLK